MSVWLCIPSARPPEEAAKVLDVWKDQGYYVALFRDAGAPLLDGHLTLRGEYPGYAAAVNRLVREVLAMDKTAEWCVAAGDDTLPDPSKTAEEIARQCRMYFLGTRPPCDERCNHQTPEAAVMCACTFGVMQPTGDRWHEGVGGFANAPIDRVAGSAWYGREYCRRMYQGDGPLFRGYQHMFVDEEAQAVAEKMGVFWQRRDLCQKHLHWGRGETDKAVIELKPGTIPPHLEKWNTAQHWNEAKALFTSRRAQGFPGHEPIP